MKNEDVYPILRLYRAGSTKFIYVGKRVSSRQVLSLTLFYSNSINTPRSLATSLYSSIF